jgi:hypothetical protein
MERGEFGILISIYSQSPAIEANFIAILVGPLAPE